MRLLVVHTWLRGNLGDVLQASVLLRALRELRPEVLDLAGYPKVPRPGAAELVALADRHVPEPFAWYWSFVPGLPRRLLIEPRWRAQREALFRRYDAIISAPGPFLAEYDHRAPSALYDLALAREIGLPFILSSHSIGPLPDASVRGLAAASVTVAREISTYEYLAARGVRSVQSADYAFLYPYSEHLGAGVARAPAEAPYRVVFMRSNNFGLDELERSDRSFRCGKNHFELARDERLVLATSDPKKDAAFLGKLAAKLGERAVVCGSVPELVRLIAGSTGVIADRYHPAICGRALGKPVEVLVNREPHKMEGLKALLAQHDLPALQGLARAGLDAVRAALPPERNS